MSDAGGEESRSPQDLTFDDEAGSLPDPRRASPRAPTGPPTTRARTTSRPRRRPSTGNTSLSVFDGTSTVGDWDLYVVDDDTGETGASTAGACLPRQRRRRTRPGSTVSGLGTKVSDVNVTLKGLATATPTTSTSSSSGPVGSRRC